jgi:pimeloyl-ACP methyl ester carboxylesterase
MKLFYRMLGEGQPLIILHGLFGMSDNWLSLAKRFSAAYKVFLIDQRNHGQSPHHPDFNYEVMTNDLFEFIKAERLENIILMGHSMGGKTAMNFALRHEAYIDKLIIVDIAPKSYNTDRFAAILNALRNLPLPQLTSRSEADMLLSRTIKAAALRQFLLKNLTRDENGHFIWKLNIDALLNNLDHISRQIESDTIYRKPMLLIKGEKSDYITEDDYPEIKRLFPTVQLSIISGATHWVHAEAPQKFFETVNRFLGKKPA